MTGLYIPNRSNMNGLTAKFVTGRSSMADAMSAVGLSGSNRKMSLMKGKSVPAMALSTGVSNAPPRPVVEGTGVCTITNYSNGSRSISVGNPLLSTSPAGGSPNGIFLSRNTLPAGLGAGSVAEFKFQGTNYFEANNTHHFSVVLRGKVSTTNPIQGKGIIIGSAHQYQGHSGVCKSTSKPNTISVESFWTTGNCLFGDIPRTPTLRNGVIYAVKVIVNAVRKTITVMIVSSDGLVNTSQTIDDPFFDYSGLDLASQIDFRIGTLPDNRAWTMKFSDISYYNYA